MLVTMTTVTFYFISAYTPTFGTALKLPPIFNLTVALCVGVSNLFWIPISAALSDRIGRKPLLIGSTVVMLLTAYVSLSWLATAPSFHRLHKVWQAGLLGLAMGVAVVILTGIVLRRSLDGWDGRCWSGRGIDRRKCGCGSGDRGSIISGLRRSR